MAGKIILEKAYLLRSAVMLGAPVTMFLAGCQRILATLPPPAWTIRRPGGA